MLAQFILDCTVSHVSLPRLRPDIPNEDAEVMRRPPRGSGLTIGANICTGNSTPHDVSSEPGEEKTWALTVAGLADQIQEDTLIPIGC
jgi:hypothetical protein